MPNCYQDLPDYILHIGSVTLLKQVMSMQKILLNEFLKLWKKKFRSFGVNNIAISSILMKKIVKY